MEDIKCPKCGSSQISSQRKGFSGGKAVAGAVLTGGIGLLAGTIGSNKVNLCCLKCGNQFKPGEDMESVNTRVKVITDRYIQNEKNKRERKIKDEQYRGSKEYKTAWRVVGWVLVGIVGIPLLIVFIAFMVVIFKTKL